MKKAFIFTFLASFFWAVSILISRVIFTNGGNPFTVAFWALIFECPFWIYMLFKHKKEFKALPLSSYKLLTARALINTFGIVIIEMFALRYSTATNYAFLIRTVILFTIVFAAIFLHERITWKKLLLAFLIIAGSYLLITEGKGISLSLGDVLTLTEAAFIALGNNVLGKKLTTEMDSDLAASLSTFIGLIPLTIITYIMHALYFPKDILLIALFALFGGILVTISIFRGYKYGSASYVTMIMSFTPVFVSIGAYFMFREILSPIQLFGGAIIVLSGVLVYKLKIV